MDLILFNIWICKNELKITNNKLHKCRQLMFSNEIDFNIWMNLFLLKIECEEKQL